MRGRYAVKTGLIGFVVVATLGAMDRALLSAESKMAIAKADFYVAPDGNDTNPGTPEKPFATLTRARVAVRERITAGLNADVLVWIRGGTYQQVETLAFGPEDSGTDRHSITYAAYPGEKVLLSGGRRITGWKRGEGEIWTAEISEVKAGEWYFRQLFVNGQRAYRARVPKRDNEKPWWNIKSSTIQLNSGGIPIPPPADRPIALSVSGPIQAWKNLSDVELVWIHNHTGSRKRLAGVDEASQTFVLRPPHIMAVPPEAHSPGAQHGLPSVGKACYLENALELLSQAGEWYLDRQSGVLSYRPCAGEDLARAEVVAPRVQKALIAVTGLRERPVRNLHFRGIHLEHADCPLPDAGYFVAWIGQLLAPYDSTSLRLRWTDAAVRFEHACNCSFSNGGIAHVGGMGVTLADGTADIAIEGNNIHDLGGGGIGAGTSRGKNITRRPYTSLGPIPQANEYRGYRIANNHIHHCGTDYFDAVGIVAATVRQSVVAHNLVHDVAYSGVVVEGYVPNDEPALAGDNTIEYNHVYNVMKVCNDGAGIYVVLPQTGRGAVIRHNLVHEVQTNPYNGRTGHSFGVYLDVESKNYHLQNNVVCRCANGPLHFCGAKREDNTWSDNVFQAEGTSARELIEAMEAQAGLEPAYRRALLRTESPRIPAAATADETPQPRLPKNYTIPIIDISNETNRRVIVAQGTKDIYHGHPATLLMPDGKTLWVVWTYGHGGPCGPLKRSNDGGLTWSELLDVPENWKTARNCPTIHRLVAPDGKARLVVLASGCRSFSEDDGRTWSPMAPTGINWGVPPLTVEPIENGRTLLTWCHIGAPDGLDASPLSVWQAASHDGGLTWGEARMICIVEGKDKTVYKNPKRGFNRNIDGADPCEPSCVRSPDGKQLLLLMRENRRRLNSLYMVSNDEGKTWSAPKELTASLTGDRHRPRYVPDGRLMLVMRDTARESPTLRHFVAWVGTYDDIVNGREGQYRVKLLHSYADFDCGYPGLEVLLDGTLVATTYIKYRPGPEKNSIVSVRFKLSELDARLKRKK